MAEVDGKAGWMTPTAPTTGEATPSSSRWREPSPPSPAPSLPAAQLDFWPPENPFSTQCGHGESADLRHSTVTQSTQLPSSSTLGSTMASSGHSSRSPRSGCSTERHRAWPLEDSHNKLLARRRRPLGGGLGSSICPKTPHNSMLATSLSLSCYDEENGALASATEGWSRFPELQGLKS